MEVHQALLDYREAMVEEWKGRNFLDGIKFDTIDASRATVIVESQVSNSFILNTGHIDHFFQKKKRVNFREISMEGQGVRDERGGSVGSRSRVFGNVRSCHSKPG